MSRREFHLRTVSLPTDPPKSHWLTQRGGGMRKRIAEFPWEKTPMGGMDRWPPHLRSHVNLMLASGVARVVIWGPEYYFIYNDQYAQILQDKHPSALGTPAKEIFPELWQFLGPLFERTYGGEAIVNEDLELTLTRGGVTKPGYFSFSYTPITDETDHVDGFMAEVLETTSRVALERAKAKVFDTVLSAITTLRTRSTERVASPT
jgi:hypothetical protein